PVCRISLPDFLARISDQTYAPRRSRSYSFSVISRPPQDALLRFGWVIKPSNVIRFPDDIAASPFGGGFQRVFERRSGRFSQCPSGFRMVISFFFSPQALHCVSVTTCGITLFALRAIAGLVRTPRCRPTYYHSVTTCGITPYRHPAASSHGFNK